jgi:uncharacterized protein (UPF0333 family)
MKYRVFIRWTVAACAVWASAYVGVGYLARASYEEVSKNLKFGGLVFVVIIIAFVVLVHFGKKRLEKSAERMIAEGEAAMAAIAGAEQIKRGEENNFDQSETN